MTLVLGIVAISLLAALGLLVRDRFERWRQKQQRRQNDVWSIGLYAGPDPVTLAPAPGISNPILTSGEVTDVPARFVADPFMIEREGQYHLFFELLNTKRKMGEIGHAVSDDLKAWRYTRVVLRERFHLSYPYVFEHNGEVFISAMADWTKIFIAVCLPLFLVAALIEANITPINPDQSPG